VLIKVLFLILGVSTVSAHTGNDTASGFVSGFTHPFFGADHIVAMVAVGLWGAFLGAPAVWLLPVVFPSVMALGGALGVMGVPIPAIETGIALSGVVLGLMVLMAARPPLWVAARDPSSHDFAVAHGCNVQVTPLHLPHDEVVSLMDRFNTACAAHPDIPRPKILILQHGFVAADAADADAAARALPVATVAAWLAPHGRHDLLRETIMYSALGSGKQRTSAASAPLDAASFACAAGGAARAPSRPRSRPGHQEAPSFAQPSSSMAKREAKRKRVAGAAGRF
jgi:hypothetical protein